MINILIITLILLTLWGLCYDDRITNTRLLIIVVFILFLGLLAFYYNKMPYAIIKDMFWYSLIMLGSFIFHALWLKWLYDYCEKKGYNYSCFIVSRTSFVLSLSFLLYLLGVLHKLIYEASKRYKFTIKKEIINGGQYDINNYIEQKTVAIYQSYNRKNIKLWLFYGYLVNEYIIFKIIHSLLAFIILIMQLCLGYFVNNFNNYCILLLGIKVNDDKPQWDYYLKKGIKLSLIFIVTLIITYLLGFSSRLYFIWLVLFVWNTLNFLYQYKRDTSIKNFIKYMYISIILGDWFSLHVYLTTNQMENVRSFALVYGLSMHYNLEYFIYASYTNINMWTCWHDFIDSGWFIIYENDLNLILTKPYPMISYLKYYTPIELVKGEYEIAVVFNDKDYHPTTFDKKLWPYEWWFTLKALCKKHNISSKDYRKITNNLPEGLTDNIMEFLLINNVKDFFIWDSNERKFYINKEMDNYDIWDYT